MIFEASCILMIFICLEDKFTNPLNVAHIPFKYILRIQPSSHQPIILFHYFCSHRDYDSWLFAYSQRQHCKTNSVPIYTQPMSYRHPFTMFAPCFSIQYSALFFFYLFGFLRSVINLLTVELCKNETESNLTVFTDMHRWSYHIPNCKK